MHVINCNIRDNFQEAATGGKWILELATMASYIKYILIITYMYV